MTELIVGETYIARNQGTAITPRTVEVTVVWLEADTVHYRKKGETAIHQTTLARFLEIIGHGK